MLGTGNRRKLYPIKTMKRHYMKGIPHYQAPSSEEVKGLPPPTQIIDTKRIAINFWCDYQWQRQYKAYQM